MMTYEEACAYIEDLPRFTKKHALSHTKEFLRRLGNPAEDKKIIHVAGTNGKGSVCAYMQAVLMSMGKRAGFFTSPHLVAVNERIRVNNIPIDNRAFLETFLYVKETVDEMEKDGVSHPSYFEFLFGMGMTAFAKMDVEYVILETGLGGRLDATNAVERPALTVITSISQDHTAQLGDTIKEIAGEKAGIIKAGVPLLFDGTDEKAARVVEKQAESLGTACRKFTKNAYEIREITDKHIAFSRPGAYDNGIIWNVGCCGTYQMMNVSLALAAMETVLPEEERDYEKWREAVASLTWEGRMEEVSPGIYVDGAHNPGAVEAFLDSLEALGEKHPSILFSAVADKEYEKMIALLCRRTDAKCYILTEIKDARKVPVTELADIFSKYTDNPVLTEADLANAWALLKEKKEGGRAYCLGSLYLAGMIKKYLADQ